MSRFTKHFKEKKDLAPESFVFFGERKTETPRITLLDYNGGRLTEILVEEITSLEELKNTQTVSWVNVYGLHNAELLQKLGSIFDIAPLFLEAIMNTDQRPRFEEGEKDLGFILKMIRFRASDVKLEADQISIILGKNYVLTFQELSTNFFEPIRNRIRQSKGKVRNMGADYLVYILLDSIIDNYLFITADLGEKIEELGREIALNKHEKYSSEIFRLKVEISFLRKNVRPVKDMILLWLKSDTEFVNRKTKPYLHSLANLITQAEENIEIYNDLLVDSMNMYNANMSQKANDIMKVLTVFASLFIPLTFFAGVYGMNFKFFPELGYRYSYPIFWAVSIVSGIALFVFFKRRKWL
jgi:magnesium transporter